MTSYLDRILEDHRRMAIDDRRSFERLLELAKTEDPFLGFRKAIQECPSDELAVIAEIKRRSPSKGNLKADLDPAQMATMYAKGGATCLSVLTDEMAFAGSVKDLALAKEAVEIPILRKDFTVDVRDICDTRIMGADAVLLIVAALDDRELSDFLMLAREVGLDALVEIHDERELERALGAGAALVGVNQRDLLTFEVDRQRAIRVGEAIPRTVCSVAESGISGVTDLEGIVEAGFRAILVGEVLVMAEDPVEAVASLRLRNLQNPERK